MRYSSTEKLLNSTRQRLWLRDLIDRVWVGLMLTSGILGMAAVLHTFHTIVTMSWWIPAALLPIAVATVAATFNRPSLEASARAADHWLNSNDLLTAAWFLRSQTPASTSTTALVVLNQADQLAADSPRSLPRLHKPRHPLPTTIAVAVAATSLFFLSLQGAAPSGSLTTSMHSEPRTEDRSAEDYWLSVPEPGLPGASPVVESTQTMRDSSDSSTKPSDGTTGPASPTAEQDEPGEPGSGTDSNALQAMTGAGAGQLASKEPSRPAPNHDASDGTTSFTDLELVALQRKPADRAMAIDRTMSVQLIPFESGARHPVTAARDAPAARAGKEAFTPRVGPAYRALQVRYFKEISYGD
jgi:hypothetical protein